MNQILESFEFDFDIRNHRELSPYMYFTDLPLYSAFLKKMRRHNTKDYHHNSIIFDMIHLMENHVYSKISYDKGNEIDEEYKKSLKKKIEKMLNLIHSKSEIEKLFSIQGDVIYNVLYDSQYLNYKLKKIINCELKKMPISTALFPHYRQLTTNYFFYDDHAFDNNDDNNIKNEQKLAEIIDKYAMNNKDQQKMISFDDLIRFFEILSKQTKAFSFSPTFVLSNIEKLDNFLNTLFPKNFSIQNNENIDNNYMILNEIRKLSSNEENKIKIKYFILIMLIKMRLYFIIQKIHEALSILLTFIIMEQENYLNLLEDDQFSFRKIFIDSLPHSKRRSKIIQNISFENIIDFYCNAEDNKDFILTKDGIFQSNKASELTKLEIDSKISEILTKSNKNNIKIAFSDEILYILSLEDKTIHKILIKNDEKNVIEEKPNQVHHYPKKEEKSVKSKNKRMNKKLREKQRKEKKAQRKKERKEKQNEKNEINLDPVLIKISDLPIISMNVFDNYVRILQQKNETTFEFTNIDLTSNSRVNFDVINSFKEFENTNEIKQTSTEIVIQNKNKKLKLNDICLSEDLIFFPFEDSSFEQWMIFQDGKTILYKQSLSPYLFTSNSKLKIDNNSFLHIIEPIKNDSIQLIKIYLPETKYYIRSDNELFIKHPYLSHFSDIVDNCSQFIINKEFTKTVTTQEYLDANDDKKKNEKNKKIKKLNPFSFIVSPEEMSTIVQSPTAIALKLNELKNLIKEIKDDELKQFFISLFIKMCGVNLLYCTRGYYSSKNKLTDTAQQRFEKFKSFILDLFSLCKFSSSLNTEIMLKESILFTFAISAKFLFLPDQYNQLHELMDNLINSNEISQHLLRTFSYFIFTFPSSLYIINDSIINQLLKYEDEIDILELFTKSLILISFELKFAKKSMNEEFINYISPCIQSAFNYAKYMINNESIPIIKIEQLLSYFITIEINYKLPFYSLILTNEMTKINPFLYERIKKVPGVIESDKEYQNLTRDLLPQTVHKEIKILESEHPYNSQPPKVKDFVTEEKNDVIIEDLGMIEFSSNIDVINVEFDNKCKISEDDKIIFYYGENSIEFDKKNGFLFNQALKLDCNKLRVKISRKKESSKDLLWGYKIFFTGISFDCQFNWISNQHLFFYNSFILYYYQIFRNALNATEESKNEKEFNLILDEKIIQGIKFEDIDNYEKELNNSNNNNNNKSNKKPKRTLTRGISRGISFDTDNDASYGDAFKKSFLKDFINANDNNNKSTRGKKLLDILYTKTAKRNRIKLNDSTKSILENERYLAACLFKQLGLINVCLKFITNNEFKNIDEIEVPLRLQSVWKKVYSLRHTLFLSYQKSKSLSNTKQNENSDKKKNSIKLNFKQYSEEIKRKCILLLYSDPILKFKEKGNLDNETIESTATSIFSFVTSEISLSNISDLIDVRRKRLSLKMQSLSYFSTFIDNCTLFNTTQVVFGKLQSYFLIKQNNLNGLTKSEFDEYHKLFDQVTCKFITKLFDNPSIGTIVYPDVFNLFCFSFDDGDEETLLKSSKVFINILEKNKDNKTFIHDLINFIMVSFIFLYARKTKNNELIEYFISLLFSDHIDQISKRYILTLLPLLIEFDCDNEKLNDNSLAFSFLNENSNSPILVRSTFYWISAILCNNDHIENLKLNDFINKVYKGIGQSFVGKSCLFIDDSFQPFAHRQVADTMISFIRYLVNNENEISLNVTHDILLNKINQIKFDENYDNDALMSSIGLFSSIGHGFSAFEPERNFKDCSDISSYCDSIIGFNPSLKKMKKENCYKNKFKGTFINSVLFHPKKFDLNEMEIENILNLHEMISKSRYFNEQQKYDVEISEKEIFENVLIASFYSFLPIIMQNQNNASIFMNNKNIKRTLSLFNFATKALPSNVNSILLLSHYLENSITNPVYRPKQICNENRVDCFGRFRFMKMNFGEIIYNDKNDLIKSRNDHYNLFLACRPFDSEIETYFEVKIKEIGNKQVFIGFVDSEEKSVNKAFGFGCAGQSQIFCRRSANLIKEIISTSDKIMKNDQNEIPIENGTIIGCYYTHDYVYLYLNSVLTKYRLSHKSVNSYIPVIFIDHDEIELEIIQNVSIVDKLNDRFEFLKIQSNDYFKEKDVIKSTRKSNSSLDKQNLYENHISIGQNVFIDKTIFREEDSLMETIDVTPKNLLRERENFAIIKDIESVNNNKYVTKLKLETYNHLTLSKEIVNDVDSRYVSFKKTNFFNLIENRTESKLSINNCYNLKCLPKEIQSSSDFNLITNYIRNKTIKDNSKSIAIIMTRYLVFVLIDYLRFIKSPLLKDEGIESDEMNCILNSLSISLPTITNFKPKFVCNLDRINDYVIFKDKNEDENKENEKRNNIKEKPANYPLLIPGYPKLFDLSFKAFLKKSENLLSPKFIIKLLQMSIDKATSDEVLSCSSLYSLIPPKQKIESIEPLPSKFEYKTSIRKRKILKNEKVVGFIPILLDSIPNPLPEVKCGYGKFRESSDKITYFNFLNDSIELNWNYDLKEIKEKFDLEKIKDFKLKAGCLTLTNNLEENLINSSLGFIQNLLNIFQVFNDSEQLFDRFKNFLRGDLLESIFKLSMKKNPLVYPFIQIIIVMLVSKYGFSDSLFSKNEFNASFIFESVSKKLFPMKEFPTGMNELPLLYSIYSNLIQTKIFELMNENQNKENIEALFDKYYNMNDNLFKISDDDDEKTKENGKNKKKNNNNFAINKIKKKNYRLLYLLYHYSSLLHNDHKLPYPMFLFVHDWIMQKFGGFRKTISKRDMNRFKMIKVDENKEIVYKSDILENDFDLSCSYQLFNIYEKDEEKENQNQNENENEEDKKQNSPKKEENKDKDKDKEKEKSKVDVKIFKQANKVFIHQLKDDKKIELPQSGESVMVSFPLEIIIVHEKDAENETEELKLGDFYIFNFFPSQETQKECFVENYKQIEEDFEQFISLEKLDNEIMELLTNNEHKESNNNDNNNNDNNNNDNNNNDNNNNDNNNNDNNEVENAENRNDYKIYELQKIPLKTSIFIPNLPSSVSSAVLSLRCSIISIYRFLIESIMVSYSIDQNEGNNDDDDENGYLLWWRKSYYSDEKAPNRYMQQIVGPAYSMCTESKFLFINKILKSETKEEYELSLIFNRFESQKYFEKRNDSSFSTSCRPLLIQLMEQVDEDSIHLLKVRGDRPFRVNLVGEGAVDAGGPAREIFSSLIIEMMNDKLGIFSYNPNRLHKHKDTNMEDLIPNKNLISENYTDEMYQLLTKRFVYAGALLAVCIVSTLPQPMKLSSFIWEYLTNENISLESIYEVDEDFKNLMKKAESIEKRLNSITDEEFKENFNHTFKIRNSYDDEVDLIPSGSKIVVTKDNLHEFIQLAKKERIHEFDKELKELKEGFDKIMIYKNITSILRPNELKLLICGEMNCNIDQMKKIMEIKIDDLDSNEKITEDQLIKMFWNTMESFSVEERMLFIRFTSGNLGLPAPGLKWEENITVYVTSREEREKECKNLVTSSTCSSEVTIPFYESEDELAKMIRISLKFFGTITDGKEQFDDVSNEFF